jgi:hypothetical protein
VSEKDDPLYMEVQSRVEALSSASGPRNSDDDQLASVFESLLEEMHGERKFDDQELLDQVERVKQVLLSITGETPTQSRIPGGDLVHRVIRKLTRRQIAGLAGQVQGLFVVQQQLIESLIAREIVRQNREMRLAATLSQHVLDRLAELEQLKRTLQGLVDRVPSSRDF